MLNMFKHKGNINRSIDSNAAHLFVYNNTKCEYIYITDTFLPYQASNIFINGFTRMHLFAQCRKCNDKINLCEQISQRWLFLLKLNNLKTVFIYCYPAQNSVISH